MKSQKLEEAIYACFMHPTSSIRSLARDFGISYSTLQYHLQHGDMIGAVHKEQMRLSEDQEKWLCNWIIEEDRQGYAPSIARVRQMVEVLLRVQGDERPLGKNWITGFKKRNPSIKTMIGRRIEDARFDAATPEVLNRFYSTLERVISEYHVSTSNIWNMDECGTALGASTNGRVMASSKKKRTRCKASGNREWVTIIECISADGKKIMPLVIFKGSSVQAQWFPASNIPGWHYTHSENGWTSNQHGIDWLKRIFIPQTMPDNPDDHRILICDEHGSHVSVDFMYEAYMNKVQLVFLPPHTSHILQPLDLTVFGFIKKRYRAEIATLSTIDDNLQVKKHHFIECYQKARDSLTSACILNGFKCTGIAPLNPRKTLESSQVQQPPISDRTPPRSRQYHIDITTPAKATDIHRAIRLISPSTIAITCRKVTKSVGLRDTEILRLQRENQALRSQLQESTRTTKRRRVEYDAQDTFVTIREIKTAQMAMGLVEETTALEPPTAASILPNRAISTASNVAGNAPFQNMQFNWQIDPALQ